MEIRTWQPTSVPNFSPFGKLRILGRNLSQNMNEKDFEKINIKMEISTWSSTSLGNVSHFEEHQVLGPNFLERI